jgi:ribosome-binding factor A
MDSVRQQKVNKLIAKELAEIFRGNAKAMFGGGFITVTGVRVSPDLGSAKVYVSIMATKDKKLSSS